MRLKSTIWVAAYVRRCQAEGAYALVRRKGSPEAGAIFVVLDHLDGRQTLFEPAPQSADKGEPGLDRVFMSVAGIEDGAGVSERLAREAKFDPDFWVVDVEDRQGRHFLDLAGG